MAQLSETKEPVTGEQKTETTTEEEKKEVAVTLTDPDSPSKAAIASPAPAGAGDEHVRVLLFSLAVFVPISRVSLCAMIVLSALRTHHVSYLIPLRMP